jgi:tetratricopeptide (TPR) repeat protein
MRRFRPLPVLVAVGFCLLAGDFSARADAPAAPKQAPSAETTAHAKIIDDLFERLAQAPDAESAEPIRALIQRIWAHRGSATADLLMARAESALKGGLEAPATELLDRLVALYPDWSLGWRRRAQSAAARGDREEAMRDLDRALQAEPRDFLAMSELAELLRAEKQDGPALDLLRRALALDPRNESLREETEELKRQIEGREI